MNYQKSHVIINPRAAGGSATERWKTIEPEVKQTIGEFSWQFTDKSGAAIQMTSDALEKGAKSIIVIGGDGTVSEAVNGFLTSQAGKKATLSILNLGTGGDFCRTLGVPSDYHIALDSYKKGRTIQVDAGKIEFVDFNGKPGTRFFVNVAGCGMAGEVVQAVNQSSKRFGGFSYYLGALGKLFSYKNKHVSYSVDGGPFEEKNIVTLAVCNGQFFGGGMQISPAAEINDGFFHITVLDNWSIGQKVMNSRNMYNGTVYGLTGVLSMKAKTITVNPVEKGDQILIDSDGDCPGMLPFKATVLPKAVSFRI